MNNKEILIEQIKATASIANTAICITGFILLGLIICICVFKVNKLYKEDR